jgi:glutathione S-transferase
MGAGFVSAGQLIRYDLSRFPNVKAWLDRMQSLKNWDDVSSVISGFGESIKDQQFVV